MFIRFEVNNFFYIVIAVLKKYLSVGLILEKYLSIAE